MIKFIPLDIYREKQAFSQLEYTLVDIARTLECSCESVKKALYIVISDKAKGIIEFSNTKLIFAMLDDAKALASQGDQLSEIVQRILDHEYVRDHPIDVIMGCPSPRRILWTIRDELLAIL